MKMDHVPPTEESVGRWKMSSLRNVFIRAFTVACGQIGLPENTVLRDSIWTAMNTDTSVPSTPIKPRAIAEAPGAPARPPREESEAPEAIPLDLEDDAKLTPLQKLEKQLATTQSKLETIRARQGTKKQTAKQKEKDPEEMEKLTAKIPEIEAKIEKLREKEVKAKPKAAAKPKPEPTGENFTKWTPTAKKHLAEAAQKVGKVVDDAVYLAAKLYLNGLSAEEFKDKKLPEHFAEYCKPPPEPPAIKRVVEEEESEEEVEEKEEEKSEDDADEENYEIEVSGKKYLVGERSMKVWEEVEGGDVRVHDPDVINAVLEKLGKH